MQRTPFKDLDGDALGEYDFREAYVRDLENIIDIAAIKKAGVRIGADPLGGASVEYWALIAEHYGLDLTVVNPDVDPTWRFMTLDWDEKIRMDPSSPIAMASLVAKRARLRHPHRQRRGCRPPRHRHPRRRADEPQPLPRGRDRLPVRASSGLADGCRGRQDPGLVDDHRPRRRVARADAARGAGRVQVVRARSAGRLGRVRRRGVGRSVVPAHRRHGLDDRQGRHPAVPAGRRDPRGDRQDAVAAVRRARGDVRVIGLSARRRTRDPRAEGAARRSCRPRPSPRPNSPASRSSRSCRTRRATAPRSAASRS